MIGGVLDTAIASGKSSAADLSATACCKWAWLVMVAFGVLILWFTFKDIQDPLLDRHSHRQTYTLISVHFMLSEGAWFPHITPVQGPEWAIPMEFPFYQWAVAGVVNLTGLSLELAGRLVSLLFWWLVLFELFRALRHFVPGQLQRTGLVLMVAAAPTSIYWSRSCLIEAMALYFSVAFGARVLSAVTLNRASDWGWAMLFGGLAALQKITTLFVMEVGVGLALLWWCGRRWKSTDTRPIAKKYLCCFLLLGGWTLAVGAGWAYWADGVKERNVMAREMTTQAGLRAWNYGTVEQRLAPDTWKHLASNITLGLSGSTPGMGYKLPLLLWAVSLGLTRRRLAEQGLLVMAFLSGPLVFLNLYYVHEYYLMANGYLLLLALGTAVVALWEDPRRRFRQAGWCLMVLLVAGQLHAYPRYRSLLLAEVPPRRQFEAEFRALLDGRLPPQETLLVYGHAADSAVAFYARRKAIIDEPNWPPEDVRMQKMLGKLAPDERIGAMIVAGERRTNKMFLRERIEAFELEETPKGSFWGDVYFRKQPSSLK
ncbi:MAG TPA: hypothetical protein VGH19_12795 [Verrucomicrobiae bacterium]